MKFLLSFMILGISLTNGENDSTAVDFANTNEKFSANFLNEVLGRNKDKNVVVSAYSVLFPLAQLSMAAVGDSRTELLNTMGLPENNVEVQNVFKDTTKTLENVKGVELKIANKIYVTQSAELNENFAKETKSVFNSEIEKINFNENVAAAANINSWVESKTNNRIKDLVSADSFDSDTRLVLVNAIYFKGKWKNSFDKSLTKNHDFHVTKSKKIQVPMMQLSESFKYGESEKLKAKLLELPYEGKETSLLVILPNEIDGVNELVKTLKDPEILEEALMRMIVAEVHVFLPKFKIETTTNLKDLLQRMGIKKLFTSEAKLNNLLKGNKEELKVDSAIQKAFIEVNEEGTEAAAANEFGFVGSSAFGSTPKNFAVDHPFVFILRENENSIFSGVIRQ